MQRDVTLIALFALMIFLFLCNFMNLGIVGSFFSGLMFGLTGVMAYVLPVLGFGLYLYYVLMSQRDSKIAAKILAILGLFLIIGVLSELIGTDLSSVTGYDPAGIYSRCLEGRSGGGIIGGTIAFVLYRLLKTFGTILVLLVGAVGCVYVLAQRSILELARDKAMDARLHRLERMEEEERYREEHPEEFEENDYLEEDSYEEAPRSHYDESRARYQDLQRERRERKRLQDEERRRKAPQNMWNTDLSEDEAFSGMDGHAAEETAPRKEMNDAGKQDAVPDIPEQKSGQDFDQEDQKAPAADIPSVSSEEETISASSEEEMQDPALLEEEKRKEEIRARRDSEELHEIRPEDYWDEEILSREGSFSEEGELPVHELPRSPYAQNTAAGGEVLRATIYRDGEDPDAEASNGTAAEADVPSSGEGDAEALDSGISESDAFDSNHSENADFFRYEEVPEIRVVRNEPEEETPEAAGAPETDHEDNENSKQAADPAPAPEADQAPMQDVPVHTERENTTSELNAVQEDEPEEQTKERTKEQTKEQTEEPVKKREYQFPPVSLLRPGAGSRADSDDELRSTAQTLQTTLRNFGVNVTITDISQGPSVTRYEMLPEMGVKVSKIVSLADDIKLALAATDIRIEAPIPGKSAIGIEVPNREAQPVALRDIVDTEEFRSQKSRLAFAVGKDIAGKPVYGDIAKMPHVLIAGATGSGKSVCINTIIMSILFHAKPDEVKLIMIDPKVVELSVYNSIPHLLIPVVTNPQKAAAALNWGVAEMEARYRAFADARVRDIKGYNALVLQHQKAGGSEKEASMHFMPQIVIVVDELADLMMVAKNDVETAICRLAQLARAAGIHLIIATQRPSVDVITGLIKANMPSRIAFRVSSGVDSRTILDMNGAEKLLGKGDMLFFPQGLPKPNRVQGCFVSDDEVTDVVNFLAVNDPVSEEETKRHQREIDAIESGGGVGAAGVTGADEAASHESDVDELFSSAGQFIIEKNNASIGLLQRRYRIGFNRAARIMDQLCEAGVVGDSEGTKSRAILMTPAQFEEYCSDNGI